MQLKQEQDACLFKWQGRRITLLPIGFGKRLIYQLVIAKPKRTSVLHASLLFMFSNKRLLLVILPLAYSQITFTK